MTHAPLPKPDSPASPTGMIKPETIAEIIDTLEYLKREFERDGKIDIINMIHVYGALRMVDHARQPSAIRARLGKED